MFLGRAVHGGLVPVRPRSQYNIYQYLFLNSICSI
jgi:hypothetical protein